MISQLPVTQCLLDANSVLADGRDPEFYLQCLVKYWEREHQSATSGWARRYSLRMRRGALAALRQVKRQNPTETNPELLSGRILESNHDNIFRF